jgi:hypothetical protein
LPCGSMMKVWRAASLATIRLLSEPAA